MDSGELFQYGPESSFNTPGLVSIHRVFLGVYFRLNCSSLTAGNILMISSLSRLSSFSSLALEEVLAATPLSLPTIMDKSPWDSNAILIFFCQPRPQGFPFFKGKALGTRLWLSNLHLTLVLPSWQERSVIVPSLCLILYLQSNSASYPDVSLSMKMCAQRKAGRRRWVHNGRATCCLYPSPVPLRFITSHSRFALASTMLYDAKTNLNR